MGTPVLEHLVHTGEFERPPGLGVRHDRVAEFEKPLARAIEAETRPT